MRLPSVPIVAFMSFMNSAALGCSSAHASNSVPASASETEPTAAPTATDASSWVEKSLAEIRVDKGEAGGMRGCTGTLTPEAKTFFSKIYAHAAECARSGSAAARGSVTFHSTLEEGGGLSEFAVLEDKLGSKPIIDCIQSQAFSVEFPSVDPKTPCVQLVHPMTFP